ncbi:MAG: hypothetical protein WDZ49_16610 [Litorilinea sp.]
MLPPPTAQARFAPAGLPQTGSPTPTEQHIYLFPAETTPVSVEVHIAELWVSASGAENFVDVDATYRLKNAEATAANPLLRIATAAGGERGVAQLPHISNVSVSAGNETVGLEQSANGNYTLRVAVPADGKLTLRLRYRVALGSAPLATVSYPLDPLNRWPDEISIRIEAKVPDTIAADSWTRVEPDGWTYGLATDPGRVDVKWLYNLRAPDLAVIFQYANPSLWQQIRALELTPAASRTFQQYNRLGEFYRQLYDAAGTLPLLRERYFAQSIAAFNNAVTVPNAGAAERGEVHYALAQLYRTHAPTVAEPQANEYAQLMVREVTTAVELLPADDARRTEMGRWRADGLMLLLNQARAASEWDRALAIVDELETLPTGSISPDFIATERADLEVQKALELLAEGQREAAFAVAGAQLSGAQLQPPAQLQTLFLRWALTVTATADQIEIVALGQTDPEHHERALRAAEDMASLFSAGSTQRSSDVVAQAQPGDWQGAPAVKLYIALQSGTNTAFLASLTPTSMDWILLRTLLEQLAVQSSQTRGLIWQTLTLRQPLDLRPATTQWHSMANSLDRQAEELDATAAAAGQNQDALAARIRAVHYRAMADRWRDLAAQSRLYFEFRTDAIPGLTALASPAASPPAAAPNTDAPIVLGAGLPTRAWFAAVEGPSQVFTMQAQLLNVTQLLVIALIALAGILAFSGLLWWLL